MYFQTTAKTTAIPCLVYDRKEQPAQYWQAALRLLTPKRKFDPLVQCTVSPYIASIFKFCFPGADQNSVFHNVATSSTSYFLQVYQDSWFGQQERILFQANIFLLPNGDPPKMYHFVKKAHAVNVKMSALQLNSQRKYSSKNIPRWLSVCVSLIWTWNIKEETGDFHTQYCAQFQKIGRFYAKNILKNLHSFNFQSIEVKTYHHTWNWYGQQEAAQLKHKEVLVHFETLLSRVPTTLQN